MQKNRDFDEEQPDKVIVTTKQEFESPRRQDGKIFKENRPCEYSRNAN